MICHRCQSPIQRIADTLGPPEVSAVRAYPPVYASPVLGAADFVVWLRGYLAAYGNTVTNMAPGDWKAIAAQLDKVGGPK